MRAAVLLTLLLIAPALANNTGKGLTLRVTLNDGKTAVGKIKLGKTKLEVRGLGKVKYGDVAVLTEAYPPTEAERTEYATRAKKLDADQAKRWARLGAWAAERDLADEARTAFQKAIDAKPDHAEARKGLGFMKADRAWIEVLDHVRTQRAGLDDDKKRMDLAKVAFKNGAPRAAFILLAEVLAKDSFNKRAIKMLRPITDRMRQKTALALPVRGRWRASDDKTRHHQKNVSAIYALDLVRVDEQGSHAAGKGKQLSDHYAYEQPFYAAAAGTVAWIRNDFPDLPVGKLGAANKSNGVGIRHGNDEISWYFHAKRGSITVKEANANMP